MERGEYTARGLEGNAQKEEAFQEQLNEERDPGLTRKRSTHRVPGDAS